MKETSWKPFSMLDTFYWTWGFTGVTVVKKNSPSNAGDIRDTGLIPGQKYPLEKEMAPHSNIPAWEIPWTEEPGRLQYMGSQSIGHN